MSYHQSKKVELSIEEAISRTIEELHKEEFGVLYDIEVTVVLKEKLSKVMEGV